jgi:N-acetylglutamate synthase-like GNAT family acetyltransferase
MVISPAERQDLPSVESLLSRSDLPLSGIGEHFDSFLVARGDGGRVVGVIGLEAYGNVGLLRSLAVEEDWRSRGLGRELVGRLFDLAQARGIETLYLLTTTAERYFPRLGFEVVDRGEADERLQASEEFRGACPATAVLMRKRV